MLSSHHLFVWKCIEIVRRKSSLVIPRVKELKCTLPNILFIIIICPWFITSNWMSPECLPQRLNQSKLQVDYNVKKSLQTKQQKWLNFTFLILAEIFRVNSIPKFNRFNLWHLKSLWNEEKQILPFTDYTSKPNLWSVHVAIWTNHVTSLLRLFLSGGHINCLERTINSW